MSLRLFEITIWYINRSDNVSERRYFYLELRKFETDDVSEVRIISLSF